MSSIATRTASVVVTVGGAACTVSASFTAPVPTGAASVTIGAASGAASASSSPPVYSAVAALVAGHVLGTATALFSLPTRTGVVTVSCASAIVTVATSFTAPVYAATVAVMVGPVGAQAVVTQHESRIGTATGSVEFFGWCHGSLDGSMYVPNDRPSWGIGRPAQTIEGEPERQSFTAARGVQIIAEEGSQPEFGYNPR